MSQCQHVMVQGLSHHGSSSASTACGVRPSSANVAPPAGSSVRGKGVTSLWALESSSTASTLFSQSWMTRTSSVCRKARVRVDPSWRRTRMEAHPCSPAAGSADRLFRNASNRCWRDSSASARRSCALASLAAFSLSALRDCWYSSSCSTRSARRSRTSSATRAPSAAAAAASATLLASAAWMATCSRSFSHREASRSCAAASAAAARSSLLRLKASAAAACMLACARSDAAWCACR
mmetsp:Transcript_13514/g.34081  ORF Transcript_13514/g.34081 Transcript_13514/m.34081 type:complete len:237 (+) Transcript_13514:128-838(+)